MLEFDFYTRVGRIGILSGDILILCVCIYEFMTIGLGVQRQFILE